MSLFSLIVLKTISIGTSFDSGVEDSESILTLRACGRGKRKGNCCRTPSLNIPDTGKLNGGQVSTYQNEDLGNCQDFMFNPSSHITLQYEENEGSSWIGSQVRIGTSDGLSYFCQPLNASWPETMNETNPTIGLHCQPVKTGI